MKNFSVIALGPFVYEGLGHHLIKTPLIYTNLLAAGTKDLVTVVRQLTIEFVDPRLMATQDFTRTYLVITPEFLPTGTAPDNQHITGRL